MRSRLAWILAVAILAGCRTVPVQQAPPASQPWDVTRPELQARDHFELKGRVAVAAGKEGFNAGLHWTQQGTRSQLSLQGPLGAGGVQITTDGDNLSVVTAHGDHLDSDAARAELASRLGFDPPLSRLRYWVLGVPDPATPAKETLDPQQQRLQSLEQDGCVWLPARMTVQRAGVRVRLIVDGWNS
jgi:outer membrane lipoprotein LolB